MANGTGLTDCAQRPAGGPLHGDGRVLQARVKKASEGSGLDLKYGGWTKFISHRFETMGNRWLFTGEYHGIPIPAFLRWWISSIHSRAP